MKSVNIAIMVAVILAIFVAHQIESANDCYFANKEHLYQPDEQTKTNCKKVLEYDYTPGTMDYDEQLDICIYHDPDYLTPLLDEQGNLTKTETEL